METGPRISRGGRLAEWAAGVAGRYVGEFGGRWTHVRAVARRAETICGFLTSEEDRDHLVAAAYLHDIGYCASLDLTGFHPYDGAVFVREAGFERLAGLVAHHSGADWDAQLVGRVDDLRSFDRETSPVADGLTYCDLTTGPAGEPMTLAQRTADVIGRYGQVSVVARAMDLAMSDLEAAVRRTEILIGAHRAPDNW